jgi:hypothetical protein
MVIQNKIKIKKNSVCWFQTGKVAYICNPSYLGGGDWEDLGL